MHLGFLTVREGFFAEESGIRAAKVCLYLGPFTGVSAHYAQTSATGSWAFEALLQIALNEHPLFDDAKAEIRLALQGVKSAWWKFFPCLQ